MVDVNAQNKTISVNVSSSGVSSNVNASGDTTLYYSNKAREWAISNRIVDNEDYSSKYYANKSQESATFAQTSATNASETYTQLQATASQALEDLATTANTALENISNTEETSIANINTVKSESIADIEAKTNEASELVNTGIANINNTVDDSLTEIETAKTTAINTVNVTKDNAITQITQEGAEQVANIERTGFYMRDDKLYFINSQGEEEEFKSGGGQYIGQTIFSFDPLYEDELHLLDGALLRVGGMYDEYINKYIANLFVKAPHRFCTEQEWQTSLSTYGVCGKYVYTEGVSVRLPKVGNYLYSTDFASSSAVIGNGKTIGITNGSQNAGIVYAQGSGFTGLAATTSSYGQNVGSAVGSGTIAQKSVGLTTDASKSGVITDLSNITSPLNGYYYIVVATGSKTDVEVNLDNIATDLNGKADVDLTNVTSQGTSKGAGWAMPSGRYVELTVGASGSTYTAPANGYYIAMGRISTSGTKLRFQNQTTGFQRQVRVYNNDSIYSVLDIPVRKNDVIALLHDNTFSSESFRFYYAEGEQ